MGSRFWKTEILNCPGMDEFAVLTGEMTEPKYHKVAAAFGDIRQRYGPKKYLRNNRLHRESLYLPLSAGIDFGNSPGFYLLRCTDGSKSYCRTTPLLAGVNGNSGNMRQLDI